jgi:two-component system sensor histidine kinase/response regulator
MGEAKILMLSSGGQPGEAQRCRQVGISAYLLKPVMKADLHRAIRITGIPTTLPGVRS